MNARTAKPNRTISSQPADAVGHGRRVERLCDLTRKSGRADPRRRPRPARLRGIRSGARLLRRLLPPRQGEEDLLDAHRDVVVAELERWEFRLLATGAAVDVLDEDPAYCLLVDAANDDVVDLRAAMVKADDWWVRGWPRPKTLNGPAGAWRGVDDNATETAG